MKGMRKENVGPNPNDKQLLDIVKMIKGRINFRHGFSSVMRHMCWNLKNCARCRKKNDLESRPTTPEIRKFRKGSTRLSAETDIRRLVSLLRNFEVTRRALLTDRELKLSLLQRNQVISSSDDKSSEEYDVFPGNNWLKDNFDEVKDKTREKKSAKFFKSLE